MNAKSLIWISVGLLILSNALYFGERFLRGSEKESIVWNRTFMDESRTGSKPVTANNVAEALGHFDGDVYVAPNGVRYSDGSTPEVARLMLDAQPKMAYVKEVIGYSPERMTRRGPESALSNMFVDELMRVVEKSSGKKVDAGFVNFGGIRCDMPKGDVLLDDILSMFPFKNYSCYVAMKGSDLRAVLERMARSRSLAAGGVRLVIKDRQLVSATTADGKPIDDNKVYGIATISFLLNGGDGASLAKNALDVELYDVKMSDFMVDYVRRLTAEGKPVEYHVDGRIKVEE